MDMSPNINRMMETRPSRKTGIGLVSMPHACSLHRFEAPAISRSDSCRCSHGHSVNGVKAHPCLDDQYSGHVSQRVRVSRTSYLL
ncbi:hypothetical protein [Delftia phage PhiW-14]|uniref:Uncharacterized protein n=1 Tax=Delftia phage PhiW-14 TaxID=665032 RepID=C9DG37_BPW14|nr:hypothetical protein DP-phiW-14_gp066 [Delftia phage PhiW-14]ACV50088.1 hypothetical protein [Delftia phage PhiW-14]